MLRLKSLSLVNKRRTIRQQYPYSYPYAATLSPDFDRTSGGQLSLSAADGLTGVAAIYPGAVMLKQAGEVVTLCTATAVVAAQALTGTVDGDASPTGVVWGLSANFVGGLMDELNDFSEIGVWRGRNGIFEVLAPVFDSGLSDDGGDPTKILTPNTSGQLKAGTLGTDFAVARVVDNFSGSANALKIELLVP